MRILIVKLGALGDVLRTTSLLAPLRARRPRCEIWWATSRAARPLLERNPYLRRIVTLEELRRLPRGVRFDLTLSLEEDAGASEAAAERSSGEFVGVYAEDGRLRYTDSSAPYYAMSLLNRGADGGLAEANRLKARNRLTYAELWLKILGLPLPARRERLRPVLVLAEADRREARALARRHGLTRGSPVGLNPGAGRRWPAKQPSLERTVRLVSALRRRFGRPVLLLGGPDEAARNRELARRTGALDAGTHHSLRAFAGIVELCGLVVTTDSLALHIATALGVPAVALVGPTSRAELEAFGRGAIVGARCSCFYRPRCRRKTSCLDRLSDAAILSPAARALPEARPGRSGSAVDPAPAARSLAIR